MGLLDTVDTSMNEWSDNIKNDILLTTFKNDSAYCWVGGRLIINQHTILTTRSTNISSNDLTYDQRFTKYILSGNYITDVWYIQHIIFTPTGRKQQPYYLSSFIDRPVYIDTIGEFAIKGGCCILDNGLKIDKIETFLYESDYIIPDKTCKLLQKTKIDKLILFETDEYNDGNKLPFTNLNITNLIIEAHVYYKLGEQIIRDLVKYNNINYIYIQITSTGKVKIYDKDKGFNNDLF